MGDKERKFDVALKAVIKTIEKHKAVLDEKWAMVEAADPMVRVTLCNTSLWSTMRIQVCQTTCVHRILPTFVRDELFLMFSGTCTQQAESDWLLTQRYACKLAALAY